MKIDAPRIKSWVERIERLLQERADTNDLIRDIFTEIKKGDHDAKAIRKLIQRRAADPSSLAEQDALLSAYTDAMAGKIKAAAAIAEGKTREEAAKIGGISTGSVSALKSRQKSREIDDTPHDPITGEVAEVDTLGVAPDERETPSPPAEQSVNAGPPSGLRAKHRDSQGEQSGTHSVEGGVANLVRDGGAPVATSTVGPAVTTPEDLAAEAERLGLAAVVRDLQAIHDDLEFPAGLDRREAESQRLWRQGLKEGT